METRQPRKTSSTNFTIQSLPERASLSNKVTGNKETFISNLYKINLNKNFTKIYQYDIKFEPQLQTDSGSIKKGLVLNIKSTIQKKIGQFIYDVYAGGMLWSCKQGMKEELFKSTLKRNSHIFQHTIILNLVKKIDIQSCDRKITLQILNVNLKQTLFNNDMIELGLGSRFFNIKEVHKNPIQNTGYMFWRGFYASIHYIKNDICLCVDVKTRVLSQNSVLECMRNIRNVNDINGRAVLASYGRMKTYIITKLSKKTPQSTFSQKGKQTTFLQYYDKTYNIQIKDRKQQLILSVVKNKLKDGTTQQQDVYLVPQLLYFTGIQNRDKNNKQLGRETRISPTYRLEQNERFIQKLDKNQLFKVSYDALPVKGYVLDSPAIVDRENRFVQIKKSDGKLNFRSNKPLRQFKIQKWILAYSQTSEKDRMISDNFIRLFNLCAKTFDIEIPKPIFYIIKDGNINTYLEKLDTDFKKFGKQNITFVVTLLKPFEDKFYPNLKKLLIVDHGVPHQVVITKKIDCDDKRALSILTNILLQIMVKVGCPLWKIQTNVQPLRGKKVLIGGMALFHKLVTKTQSCCAFVGNIDNEHTKYYSNSKLIPTNQQRFQSIKIIIEQWVKKYCKQNKTTPDFIILYREGVGQGQVKSVLDNQVSIIEQTIKLIAHKMKQKDYEPQVAFVLVNRKNNKKFFETQRSRSRQRSRKKFCVDNPPPGSVIGQQLSSGHFDYQMSPHFVNQGSCTPTNFQVIFNTTSFKQDDFWQLSNQLCSMYYNWQGPVRVPAVLQYANKLATLVGDNLKIEPGKLMSDKLYYL